MRGEKQKVHNGGTAMMFKFVYRYCILNLNGISVFAFVFGGEFESSAAIFEKNSRLGAIFALPYFYILHCNIQS